LELAETEGKGEWGLQTRQIKKRPLSDKAQSAGGEKNTHLYLKARSPSGKEQLVIAEQKQKGGRGTK